MDRHACACAPHLPIERVLVTDDVLVLTVVSMLANGRRYNRYYSREVVTMQV
jgi:hypothetical protein